MCIGASLLAITVAADGQRFVFDGMLRCDGVVACVYNTDD